MKSPKLRQKYAVDESVPSQQGLKRYRLRGFGPTNLVDESVPSQQGLKQHAEDVCCAVHVLSMSPFHHNKD